MLSIMRKHAQSWLIKILLGLIVVVFVLYFGVSRYGKEAVNVATVNGENISMLEYRETYNNLLKRLQAQYGDMVNDKLIESLNLKQQALDQLINERLLMKEAERLKFTVTPEELTADIRTLPYFQNGGKFDQNLYVQVLRANRMEPGQFEDMQSRNLLVNKVRDYITGNVVLDRDEVLTRYLFEHEKIVLEYLPFAPENYLDKVSVSDQEIEDFFKKNIKNYAIPPQTKMSYLLFPIASYMDKIKISPEEIQDEYNANLDHYKQPEQVQVEHILIKVKPNDPKSDEEAKAKAEKVLALVKEGKDFAALAKEYSDDPSAAQNSGDLGFITKGTTVKPFEDAAFAMKPGETSGLVKTQFGYHILKVLAKKEARTQTLDEVKNDIETSLKKVQASDLAYQKADTSYDEVLKGRTMADIGKEEGVKYVQTDFFPTGQPIQGLEGEEKVAQTAATLEPGEPSPVMETAQGYVIVRLDERKPERDAELKEVKDKVEQDLKMNKAGELAKEEAKKFHDILKNWKDLPKEASNEKFEVKTTEPFVRGGMVPPIGYAPAISEAAFSLTEDQRSAPEPLEYNATWYLIRLKQRIPATNEDFEKERPAYTSRMLSQKKSQVFSHWLDTVRKRAEIVMHEKL